MKDILYIFFKLKYYPDNYSLCRLWEIPKTEWAFYYGSIYDPYQRAMLRKEILPLKYRLLYDDKDICYRLCKERKLPLPKYFGTVETENYLRIIEELVKDYPNKKFIIKPIEGRGGADIFLAFFNNGNVYIRDKNSTKQIDKFRLNSRSVIQEYIEQHIELSKISSSVNTIRIVTFLNPPNEVLILGAFIRFGILDSFIDNTSQGGIKVGIKTHNGTLNPVGCDKKSNLYYYHPTSNFTFKGFKIPYWDDVKSLAINVQKSIPYNKLMGQDIAITPNGPVLIEINAEYDNVGLEQACGPILKDKNVWKIFLFYNLLINRQQKNLFDH